MKKTNEEKTENKSEKVSYVCEKCDKKTPNEYLVKGKWLCWECFLKRNEPK